MAARAGHLSCQGQALTPDRYSADPVGSAAEGRPLARHPVTRWVRTEDGNQVNLDRFALVEVQDDHRSLEKIDGKSWLGAEVVARDSAGGIGHRIRSWPGSPTADRDAHAFLDSLFDGEPSAAAALRLAQDGLVCDGDHHKQWFLEEIVAALNGTAPDHEVGTPP
jgi:hypothetical protein